MKQFLFSILTAAIPWATLYSQLQQNYSSNGNTVVSSAVQIKAVNLTLGPTSYQATGAANLDIAATDYLYLEPEFSMTGTSGEGHFYITNFKSFHPNGFTNIPRYERFELGLKLPDVLQNKIDAFLANYTGSSNSDINPYDPDEIYVECVYHLPSGNIVKRPGFYYQPYSTANNTYTELTTDYPFRIRIAPPEVGLYNCEINVYTGGFPTPVYTFSGIQFNVVTSPNPGHLVLASPNLRKMKYENGTYFFGIGQNLGAPTFADKSHQNDPGVDLSLVFNPSFDYFGMGANGAPNKLKASPNTNMRFRNEIRDMAINKGNFARMRLDETSFPLEYADFRSLSSNHYSLENCLTNFHHNQMFLTEFDSALFLCEKKDVHIMLNIFHEMIFGSPSSITGQNSMIWDDYPYSTIPDLVNPNEATRINDFFISPDAKARFKKRLLYIQARWGYSTSIGLWEFINETENIGTYNTTSANYNPNLEGYVNSWVCEMAGYIQGIYPRHLSTNGTIGLSFNNYSQNNSPCLDVYSSNVYSNEVDVTAHAPYPHKDNMHQMGADAFATQYPFIWGEIGSGVKCYVGASEAWKLADYRNDRSFHNHLWATTVSGNAATGLNFLDAHQDFNIQHRANYNALSKFVSHVNWYTELAPFRFGALPIRNMSWGTDPLNMQYGHELYNLYMLNTSHNYAVGWSFIRPSFWAFDAPSFAANDYNNAVSCVGLNLNTLQDYDISLDPQDAPIEIRGMAANHTYRAEIFDTYYAATNPFSIPVQSDANGTIKFHLSFFNHADNGHQYLPDRAWIIHDDVDGFDFGQVQQPEQDIYRAKQYDSDLLPRDDRGRKGVIETASAFAEGLESVKVYPNPANGSVFLRYDSEQFPDMQVLLYDLTGKLLKKEDKAVILNTSELESGLYMLHLKSGTKEKVVKLNITH